jgi:hypothetical protein
VEGRWVDGRGEIGAKRDTDIYIHTYILTYLYRQANK